MNQSPADSPETGTPTDNSQRRADQRRRRLIGAGLSTPVLMTLTSRPSWAQGGVCTPSAMASADLSGRHAIVGCGKSAGFWKKKEVSWPLGVSKTEPFSSVFGSISYTKPNDKKVSKTEPFSSAFGSISYTKPNDKKVRSTDTPTVILFDGLSLGQVIDGTGGGGPFGDNPGNIGLHAVGAYVNAMAFGKAFGYYPDQIVRLVQEANNGDQKTFEALAIMLEDLNKAYDDDTDWKMW